MKSTTPAVRSERFALYRDPHRVRVATFAEDVVTGLGTRPYALPPKYFYDDLGSALFEAITQPPQYYLTRIERDLLATYSSQVVASFDESLELVEVGSGSATKTRLIIEAILAQQSELTYHPVDISPDALIESSHVLIGTHGNLRVTAYATDSENVAYSCKRLRVSAECASVGANCGSEGGGERVVRVRLVCGGPTEWNPPIGQRTR
jgi:uncharacterized SAM-dependent methyltransferase